MSSHNPFDDILLALSRIEHLLLKSKEFQKKPIEDDGFLSIEQAAAYLNIPKTTLYQYTSRREITFSKPGRRLLFRKSDLEAFILNSTKKEL